MSDPAPNPGGYVVRLFDRKEGTPAMSEPRISYQRPGVTVWHGRCEDVHRLLPDGCADLILCDPPYFRVKDEWWDRQWDSAAGFLDWLDARCQEWRRLLKPNGSLYVFASPEMAARVECRVGQTFRVLNGIRWVKEEGWHHKTDKEELRSFLSPWEHLVFAEQFGADGSALMRSGYAAACEELRGFVFEPLRAYLDGERERAGISFEDVRQMVGCADGSGLPSHWFTASQWQLPTAEQYGKLQRGFQQRGDYLRQEYEALRQEYEALRQEYEALRRPFTLTKHQKWADIWDFATVPALPGKHPCEKPIALLEHVIRASTRPGATVLDSCAGSGSTLRAALNLGREAIGIEVDAKWCRRIADRCAQERLPLEVA